MKNIVNEYLLRIKREQKSCRAAGDTSGAEIVYHNLIEELLSRIESLSYDERSVVHEGITRECSGLLLGAAQGAAIWSIRENRSDLLKNGVRALLVEGGKEDFRETFICLALLEHSASRLGVNLQDVYQSVKSLGTIEGIRRIDEYFATGGKTIDDMGYAETKDSKGKFMYSRLW